MVPDVHDCFRYLPITDRCVRWGLYLTGCGHLALAAHGQHPPQGHPQLYGFQWDRGRVLPDCQVIYLLQGKGTFESAAAGKQALAAGDVFLLFPGVWHRYRPLAGSAWETLWCGFHGTLVDAWIAGGVLSPQSPVLHVGQKPELIEAYQRLIQRACGDAAGNLQCLAAGTMEILALLLAPDQPEPPQPSSRPFAKLVQDRLVAEAVRLIWTTGRHAITVSDVVAAFPASRRSLERRFQHVLGHTILDEIIRCRVERAKQLLAETDLPLKAVAAAAGFSSTERMSKVFHRAEGVTPAQYRRSQPPIGDR